VDIKPRRMLLLQSPSSLTKEESWLRKAYLNIVKNLVQFAIDPSATFDPFSAKFMGLDSIERNKHQYRAFMEVTSYFWGSKGGRGALLEKVVAAAGGPTAANGMLLSQIPQWIASIKNNKEVKEWKVTGSAPRLKFDLLNVIGDRLVFLEIKNRVDSGGTAAREEALAKKFLALSKVIQNGEKAYVADGQEMDIAQALLSLGIKKVEMHAGFLFGVDGNEATIESDKTRGFFAQSKRLLEDYYKAQNHRFSVKLTYDEALQRISFEKDGLAVVVDLLYGSDVTREYTPDRSDLQNVLHKVFTRQWDDVWLSLNIAISQRALLLEDGNNHMMQIRQLLQAEPSDSPLINSFRKFSADQNDSESLSRCISVIKQNNVIKKLPIPASSAVDSIDALLADCLYIYAVVHPKSKKVKSI
jgi:hypothetical protein